MSSSPSHLTHTLTQFCGVRATHFPPPHSERIFRGIPHISLKFQILKIWEKASNLKFRILDRFEKFCHPRITNRIWDNNFIPTKKRHPNVGEITGKVKKARKKSFIPIVRSIFVACETTALRSLLQPTCRV